MRAGGPRVTSKAPTADEAGGGRYDLRGARGVQVGDSNRQVNYFGAESEAGSRG